MESGPGGNIPMFEEEKMSSATSEAMDRLINLIH